MAQYADNADNVDDELALMIKIGLSGQTEAVEAARRVLSPENVRNVREPDVVHATVLHLGLATDSRAPSEADRFAPLIRVPPFTLVFDRCEWFPYPPHAPNGIAVLTCSDVPPEWRALRDQLSEISRRLKLAKTGGAQPHLTMAYNCAAFDPIALDAPVVWRVTDFQLIRILMRQKAHQELGRWPLR